MIYVKMLVDKSVNGFERKKGEVIKTDQWTAISLVDRGEADFTNDVPKEVAEKTRKGMRMEEPESGAIEPEEDAMMPSPKPKKFGMLPRTGKRK